MHYIRFLKTPKIVVKKLQHLLSAVVTITTDLGESFLEKDIILDVAFCALNSEVSSSRTVIPSGLQWRSFMRALPLTIQIPHNWINQPFQLLVSCRWQTAPYQAGGEHRSVQEPASILSVWSAPLDLAKRTLCAEKVVERRIALNDTVLHIWEETGESIARHIWDAGLAFATYVDALLTSGTAGRPLLRKALEQSTKNKLRILELGTGCGIVGICLASLIQNCHVVATDLPDAESIARRNLSLMKPAEASSAEYQTLDWEDPLPDAIAKDTFDMIVFADCTYNSDSIPALVRTLASVADTCPDVLVVAAMKFRHSSEAVFFELMAGAGFKVEEDDRINLACHSGKDCKNIISLHSDVVAPGSVHIFTFSRQHGTSQGQRVAKACSPNSLSSV